MDRILVVALAGAIVTALLLAILVGPVVTAFIVASTSFLLMLGVMAARGVSMFEQWWQSHSWVSRRTKTH